MTKPNLDLNQLREKIDVIDADILQLIEARAQLNLEVAKAKRELDKTPIYYRPEREMQLLRAKLDNYQGTLLAADIIKVFRSIMSACRSLQQQQRIACLGPEGTFSHAAVLQQFGHSTEVLPVATILQVAHAVENDQAMYGVVPIENSTSGIVTETLDMFLNSSLKICGEVVLPVQFHVLRRSDAAELKTLYAHRQAQLQCSVWLASQVDLNVITVSSNAKAAELAAADIHAAALAGDLAADKYKLVVTEHNVENDTYNHTRFLVIGKQSTPASGHDKTTLLIASGNQPGELFKIMQPLAAAGINVTLIESRPYKHQNWRYMFLIDVEGHVDNDPLKTVFSQLSKETLDMTVLGSYPRALIAGVMQ